MRNSLHLKLFAILALGSVGAAISARSVQLPDQPKIKVKLISKAIAPGATVKGEVEITFAEGLHGYQNPPFREYEIPVSIAGAKNGPAVKATYPKGHEIDFAGAKTMAYEGKVVIPFTFVASKKLGLNSVFIAVTTQQCNVENCFPPNNEISQTMYKVIKPTKTTR